MSKLCEWFTNQRLQACQGNLVKCQEEKQEALTSLGNLIDQHSELEVAHSELVAAHEQCPNTLAAALEQVEQWRELVEPPFDLDAPFACNGDFINTALSKIQNWGVSVSRIPLDRLYHLATADEMKMIIEWDWVDKKQYIVEFFDCENSAFWFKARVDGVFHRNQVGLVIDWSGGHAYNVIVLPDGDLWIFEPQNDHYWSIDDHSYSGMYTLQSGVVLI